MKFSINKKELLSALQLLSKATPIRSTLPIISSGLFVVENNKLCIRTTDLEISIKINCIISDAEDGSVAIPISKLLEKFSISTNIESILATLGWNSSPKFNDLHTSRP